MLRFTKDHEWIRLDGDTATVGITDYAQHALGDVVYVELPAVGATLSAGGAAATVESVKAASEVYAPVAGTVAEINGALEGDPSLVNTAPQGEGWFLKLHPSAPDELKALLDEAAYKAFLAELD